MKRRNCKVYIEDILESIDKIERYIKGLNFEKFAANVLIIDAVLQNLEIIGEASRNIPENIRRISGKYQEKISRYSMEKNDWFKEYRNS